MKKRIYLTLIILLVKASAYATSDQYTDKDEKKIAFYLEQAKNILPVDDEKGVAYLDSASLCLNKNTDKQLYAEYYHLLSVRCLAKSEIDKAIEYSFKANKLFNNSDNFKRIADSYFVMGRAHLNSTNPELGISELLRASEMYDSLKLEKDFIRVQTSLGRGFYYMKDLNKAKKYFLVAKNYADNKHDTTTLLTSLNNLGIICDELGGKGNHEALDHYRRAIKICQIIGNEKSLIPNYLNLGFDYFLLGKKDSAFILYKKAQYLAKKYNNSEVQLVLAASFGNYYKDRQMNDSALYYIDNGIKLHHELSHNLWTNNLLLLKSEVLKNQGRYKDAYDYLKESKKWQDTVYNSQILRNTKELEAKYENQKKMQLLDLQQKEIDSQNLRAKILFIAIVLLFLLILSSVFFLFKISAINRALKQKNETINQTNKELQEVIQTRDKMTSVIAHDIRNPLGAIVSIATLGLETDPGDAEQFKNYSGMILESSTRLLGLLDNLLQWSKSQSQGIKVNLQDFPVGESVEDVLALLKQMAADKQINIQNLCDSNLLVKADRDMLNTMIRNILTNAIKFTGNGGLIKLTSSLEGKYVRIDVQDNGVGISKENISKLFDIRADRRNLSKTSERGTGLGLLLCNEFIRLNNGYINVTSEEGKGSCFSIYIPQGKSQMA